MSWYEIKDASGVTATIDLTRVICVSVHKGAKRNICIKFINGDDMWLTYTQSAVLDVYEKINRCIDSACQKAAQPYEELIKSLREE